MYPTTESCECNRDHHHHHHHHLHSRHALARSLHAAHTASAAHSPAATTNALRHHQCDHSIEVKIDERLANAATFRLMREDHTAGNLLRMQLLRDPVVRFAGYRIPHPLEKDIEVLIQVKETTADKPLAALERSLKELHTEFGRMKDKFQESMTELAAAQEDDY